MAKIISKLNLNKTPQQADDYSLVYARNIKILTDGSIGRDAPITEIDLDIEHPDTGVALGENEYIGSIPHTDCIFNLYEDANHKIIIGVLRNNGEVDVIGTGAKYNGGTIEGLCISNLRNDRLLVLGEYDADIDVPLRIINLDSASYSDSENIYYVAPEIPITNLKFVDYYESQIPKGIYQFYIRYKTKNKTYTNWFVCSKELRTYNLVEETIGQGSYIYNDIKDSTYSFAFDVEHINSNAISNYKEFQLAFIVRTDDETKARIWNTFDINTNLIYFALGDKDLEEIDFSKLLEDSFQLLNVKNVAYFKNKVYISNYKENVEPAPIADIQSFINNAVSVTVKGVKVVPSGEITAGEYVANTAATLKVTSDSASNNILVVSQIRSSVEGSSFADLTNNSNAGIIQQALGLIFDKDIESIWFPNQPYEKEYKYTNSYPGEDTYIKGYGINYTIKRGIRKTDEYSDVPSGEFQPLERGHGQIIIYHRPGEYGVSVPVNTRNVAGAIYALRDSSSNYEHCSDYINRVFKFIYPNGLNVGKFADVSDTYGRAYSDTFTLWYKYRDENEHDWYYEFTITISNENKPSLETIKFSTQTMIPFQEYNLYIHFVNKNGIISKGYLVEEGLTVPSGLIAYNQDTINAIYPSIRIERASIPSSILQKYISVFFTIQHTKTNTIMIHDIHSDITTQKYVGDSLDLDLLNYSLTPTDNITIRQRSDIIGEYVYSGTKDSSIGFLGFGCSGKVVFASNLENIPSNTSIGYIKKVYNLEDTNANIIKCTPNISLLSEDDYIIFDDYKQVTIGGFLCRVAKLTVNEFTRYVAGSELFKKNNNPLEDNTLEDLSYSEFAAAFDSVPTGTHLVYSNYDLCGIGLTEEPTMAVKTKEDTNHKYKTFVGKFFSSLTLSDVYKILPDYKIFTRKPYLIYDSNETEYYQFDNTIRGSELIGDEERISVTFTPAEYYNVPTDKGIIVNLVSIGDIILVHTEHSAYKFSGRTALTSSGGTEIQTKETDVFDTGIGELYGSDKGYGGLQDKHHACISQIGYVFWEKDTNRIYINTGQPELKCISNNIRKLLERLNPDDVVIANDFYNDRLLFCFKYNNLVTKYLTISYSFITQEFASIHSFSFIRAFNTKNKAYIRNIKVNGSLGEIGTTKMTTNDDYGDSIIPFEFLNETDFFPKRTISHTKSGGTIIQIPTAYVDVLVNTDYENIKILNSIAWICNAILKYERNDNEVAEEKFDTNLAIDQAKLTTLDIYGGDLIEIYTDSADTGFISLTDLANNVSINVNNEGYKKPRYNEGIWSLNYFRNKLNTNNVNDINQGYSDQQSLVYGKYFVIRFIFRLTKDFKLENLIVNTNNKYQLK